MRNEKKAFHEVLEQLRIEKGIGKSDLARLAGLTPGYVSHLTLGERRTPSAKVIEALALALSLDEDAKYQLFDAAGLSALLNSSSPDSVVMSVSDLFENDSSEFDLQKEDWTEAPPNTQALYGRQEDLQELKQWILQDHCQMVAVLGIGGVGKTLLSARVVEEVRPEFDVIFWRSLQNMPSLEEILRSFILLVARRESRDVSIIDDDQLLLLFTKFIQRYRCMIILDNFESVLQNGGRAGFYQQGYDGYGKLLQRIGATRHQSCLMLTSREKPKEFYSPGGKKPACTHQKSGWHLLARGKSYSGK